MLNQLKSSIAYPVALATILAITSFPFQACNSVNKKTAEQEEEKIAMLQLPAKGQLTGAELKQLRYACEKWYDSMLAPSAFNGGMLVAKKGNIIFEKYKGTNPLGTKDSINSNTSFHIASVSKTFTAMAVLQMWQNKLLNIDDELSKYLTAFNYPGVTIRSLLNHRSGLPNYVHFIDKTIWKDSLHLSNQQIFDILVSQKNSLENIGTPGKHFSYCNTNYALLALLIEKISGKSYPVYMKEHIFQPLGMKNSFVYTRADSSAKTNSYDWKGGLMSYGNLEEIYGDKNIYSTPQDLFTWDRALAAQLICNTAVLEQAYAPYSNEKPGIKNYGLGWRMNIYPNGSKVIFHNGWWHGNNAAFVRLLDQDVVIIVVGNRFTRNIYKAYQLVNSFGNYFKTAEDEDSTGNP
jgi:CubicO group peptidase (beta-lactamase class C family)